MTSKDLRKMTGMCLLLCFALTAVETEGAFTSTISWKNPTTYADGRGIDPLSRSTVETRLYVSYDRSTWTQFAHVTGGKESWTGQLPAGEGSAYYAATAIVPVDGVESRFSEILRYPSAGNESITPSGGTAVIRNCRDTYVDVGSGARNFASFPMVRTYVWPGGRSANRGFLKWDLSVLPAGSRVTNATVSLYYAGEEGGGGDDVVVVTASRVVGTNPDLDQCTWYSPDSVRPWGSGADGGAGDLDLGESAAAVGNIHGWVSWNVTNMVREWAESPWANFGMAVDADGAIDSNRYFASNEYPDADLRPRLTVSYDLPQPQNPFPVPPGGSLTASVANDRDTYLNLGSCSGTNYSSEPYLRTYTWPKNNVANRGLIRWDLSGIPAGAAIGSATLWLYYAAEERGGVDNTYTVTVSKLAGARPDPGLATWNTQDGVSPWPGGSDGGASAVVLPKTSSAVGRTHQWISWDVTELVKSWRADRETHPVMAVEGDPSAAVDSNRSFASKEYPDETLRPQLHITYTPAR